MRYLRYTRGLYLLAGGTPAGGALQEESEDRTEVKVKSQGFKGKLRKIKILLNTRKGTLGRKRDLFHQDFPRGKINNPQNHSK